VRKKGSGRKRAEAPVAVPPTQSHPPPPPVGGRRLVSVLVRERNTGQMTIIPQGDDQAWLCDADGTWYQHDAALTAMLAGAGSDLLGPRLQVDQKVVFQLREDARPSRVRIVQHGYQWTKIADWKLD
jgi:hypothetical protein